jgi:hypothetical protein
MRKEKITRYEITKSNQRMIRNYLDMAVRPHLNADNPEEIKMINILLQEKYVFEDKMNQVLNFLEDIRKRIERKQEGMDETLNDEKNSLPEVSEGIIARPKEYVQNSIENYRQQQRFIHEIVTVLTVEDEYDPDEEDE